MARPFPVDPALTAIAIGFRNPAMAYIADDLLPRQMVGAEKFSWLEYPIGSFFTTPDPLVGRRGRVARVEFSGIERTDQTQDYGLEDAIPMSDIDEAAVMRARQLGSFNPVDTATQGITDMLLINRERRVAALAQNPASYAAARRLVLSGNDQFSDYTNSKPIDIIKAALSAVLVFRPNVMAMSQEVFDVLSSHPHLVNAIRGNVTGRGIVTKEEIAKLFTLDKVLIGQAFGNSAKLGQIPILSRIWGKHIVLAYINPMARPENAMTFGLTAQYGNRIAGQWEDKDVGLTGGQVVRVGERLKELITAPDVGFLLQNVIA